MSNPNHPGKSDARILQVLEQVAARRLTGDDWTDESVAADHPELMPELGAHLRALRLAENARRLAGSGCLGVAGDQSASRPARPVPLALAGAFTGYEIESEIGRGAMGVVYKARQTATRRDVAIKVMIEGPFAGRFDRARIEREARILGQLKHPSIVSVYDTGVAEGNFYIVMDYIAGRPLDAHMAATRSTVEEKTRLFGQICEAVGAAHLRGVIHRDLKPGNIRVDEQGRPHVLDFGLATIAGGTDDGVLSAHSMTMTGQFVGSLPWASPEQAEGRAARVDVRTDVYSLGVVFYQILTGRFPYPIIGNIRDVIDNIVHVAPDKPGTVVRRLDDDVETIVLKCLAKEPERRYQSAIELSRDVQHYLAGEPIEAKRDSSWYVLRKVLRRHKAAVALSAAFAVMLVGFAAVMSVLYARAERDADRARRTLAFLETTLFTASSQRLGGGATLVEVLDDTATRVENELADHPEVAAAIHYTIGDAYNTLWRNEDAAEHLRRSFDLYRETLGPDAPETLRAMVLLGMVLAEMGDARSLAIHEEALSRRLKLYGEEHPLVADSIYEIAFAQGVAQMPPRFEEAEANFEKALGMYRRFLGERHVDIARCLTAYGGMRFAQNRLDDAVRLYETALAMGRELLGDEHQFVIECRLGYARTLRNLERFDEAEVLLREVLTSIPKRFGADKRPYVLRQLATLANVRGDGPGADKLINESIAVSCEQSAEEHPVHAAPLRQFAETFRRETDVSATVYRDALFLLLEIRRDLQTTIGLLLLSAEIRERRQDLQGAESLVRAALDVIGPDPDRQPVWRAEAMVHLGSVLSGQKRFGEAEAVLLDAKGFVGGQFGADSIRMQQVSSALVRLYNGWGRPDAALPYRAAAGAPGGAPPR